MGLNNIGGQNIIWKFLTSLDSQNLNTYLENIIDVGVYKGMDLIKINDTTTKITSGAIIVEDEFRNRVKINFENEININVDIDKPYIVVKYAYNAFVDNYADILIKNYNEILPQDVIIGKCLFDELGALSGVFDYSMKTISKTQTLYNNYINLLVIEDNTSQTNRVKLLSGKLIIGNNLYNISEQIINLNPADLSFDRIDLIYINNSGVVTYEQGTASLTPYSTKPTYIGKYVLAEIYRKVNNNSVYKENITILKDIPIKI